MGPGMGPGPELDNFPRLIIICCLKENLFLFLYKIITLSRTKKLSENTRIHFFINFKDQIFNQSKIFKN